MNTKRRKEDLRPDVVKIALKNTYGVIISIQSYIYDFVPILNQFKDAKIANNLINKDITLRNQYKRAAPNIDTLGPKLICVVISKIIVMVGRLGHFINYQLSIFLAG